MKQAKEDGIKAQAAKAKARAAKIKKLAETKGVAKQSAAELYVAEKMLPFFATGSEYQKRYSVPAAVRQKAVARIVKTQEKRNWQGVVPSGQGAQVRELKSLAR